jgi:DNA-binding transcriptional ArsR family regulator
MGDQSALAALADPTRRRVFERLRAGPLSVGDIARCMPVSRPAVSQHLKVLKQAGLVADRPEGARRVYYIDAKGLGGLRAWLDRLWDEALVAFRADGKPRSGDDRTRKHATHDHHRSCAQEHPRRRRSGACP